MASHCASVQWDTVYLILTRRRFCEEELPEDTDDKHDPVVEADRVDREVDVSTVRAFLGWLLLNGNFKQLDAVMCYSRHWRMAFRHHLQRRINDRIVKDMKAACLPYRQLTLGRLIRR